MDGEALDVSDVTYNANQIKRETQTGQNGVHGFSAMPVAPSISFTVRDAGNLSQQSFNQMTSSTVVIQLANGKTVYGDGMWTTEVAEVNTTEGTFKVTFEGITVTEQAL